MLERITQAPRSRRRLVAVVGVLSSAIALCAAWRWRSEPNLADCERAVLGGRYRQAIESCEHVFQRNHQLEALYWQARAHFRLARFQRGAALGERLLSTRLAAEAHELLGFAALRDRRSFAALLHARIAMTAYAARQARAGEARAATLLSQVYWQIGEGELAMSTASAAVQHARGLAPASLEIRARTALADALRLLGDSTGAAAELAKAVSVAGDDQCELAWLKVKRGLCWGEVEQSGLARMEFELADQHNRACPERSLDVRLQVAMNQALLVVPTQPARAEALVAEVVAAGRGGLETDLLRAYAAASRGDLDRADDYLAHAATRETYDADWAWRLELAQAQLAEERGGADAAVSAEQYYRRAIASVERVRAGARRNAATFVASHRGPYDGLISLLARQARWRDALAVVLALDAGDMLRATASSPSVRGHVIGADDHAVAVEAPPSVEQVLRAWRGKELSIALAPVARVVGAGRQRALRLVIRDGEVTGAVLGDARRFAEWGEALYATPGDVVAGRALATLMVPPGDSATPLSVLAIGRLARAPLAALRDADGELVIARRRLVRALGLWSRTPPSAGRGAPVVIADPGGDLPDAVREGAAVAARLGVTARLFGSGAASAATRASLLAARDASVLHLASHVAVRGRTPVIALSDAEIDGAELVRLGVAPRLAVLASCGSAAASDDEGWGSIAAALLLSGTSTVVATDRSVEDGSSAEMMQRFYGDPSWQSSPVEALGRVQVAAERAQREHAVSDVAGGVWASYVVLERPPTVRAP